MFLSSKIFLLNSKAGLSLGFRARVGTITDDNLDLRWLTSYHPQRRWQPVGFGFVRATCSRGKFS